MDLTIGITSYNKSKYIRDCLDSIPDGVEVIIVDDSSTDNTIDIIKSNCNHSLVEFPQNRGVSFCRNLIVDLCETEYLMFLDGDDELNIKDINIIINSCDNDIYMFPYTVMYPEQNISIPYRNIRKNIRDINCILTSLIFKTSFIRNNKIRFDERLRNLEDFDFILNCISIVEPIYIDNVYICNYRKYSDGKRLKNNSALKKVIRDKYLK